MLDFTQHSGRKVSEYSESWAKGPDSHEVGSMDGGHLNSFDIQTWSTSRHLGRVQPWQGSETTSIFILSFCLLSSDLCPKVSCQVS